MGWIYDFFDISIDRANQFYAWGWRASVVGAVITMCGVALLWFGTRVRDRDFDTNIAELHDKAATSDERSKILERGNLSLQRDVERERIERLKLEEALAPRTYNQVTVIQAVKDLAPIPVFIVAPPDFEPRRLQDSIATVFGSMLHWPVAILSPSDLVPNGVHICFVPPPGGDLFDNPLGRAAYVIANAMKEHGVDVTVIPSVLPRYASEGVTPDGLLFRVGTNPKLNLLGLPEDVRERLEQFKPRTDGKPQ